MIRYKCPACGKNQYSASGNHKPCIYCGNSVTVAQATIEEGKKENEQIIQQPQSDA